MKLEKTRYSKGVTYITIRADYKDEAIVIVAKGKNEVALKGTNLVIKGDTDDE